MIERIFWAVLEVLGVALGYLIGLRDGGKVGVGAVFDAMHKADPELCHTFGKQQGLMCPDEERCPRCG